LDFESLDHNHPVVASATVGELMVAIQEAAAKVRCPLETTVSRWLGARESLSIGVETEVWQRLSELRYKNLSIHYYLQGRTAILHNAVEAFQVCYYRDAHNGVPAIVYHVQALVAAEPPAYYRMIRSNYEEAEKLSGLDSTRFSDRRTPSGMMSGRHLNTVMSHTESEPVSLSSLPLHKKISQLS